MAYQSGTATSPSNLLDTIRVFVLANGWTVNYAGADSKTDMSATYQANYQLSVRSPSGSYFHMLAYNTSGDIYTSGSTGYTNGVQRNAQPGHSSGGTVDVQRSTNIGWACTNKVVGPYTGYHLFVGSSYLHVVLEVVTNRFVHLHIGSLDKAGPYTGGEYFTGTSWTYDSFYSTNVSFQNDPEAADNSMPFDSYCSSGAGSSWQGVRYDVDGTSNRWVRMGAPGTASSFVTGCLRRNSLTYKLFQNSPNTFNGSAALIPSIICGPRTLGGVAILGSVPNMRVVSIANMDPKQEITLGSDVWKVFPIIRKGVTSEFEASSGNYALAYKKA